MSAAAFLAASSQLTSAFLVVAAIGAGLVAWSLRRPATPVGVSLSPAREALLLALVVGVALVMRTAGARDAVRPA